MFFWPAHALSTGKGVARTFLGSLRIVCVSAYSIVGTMYVWVVCAVADLKNVLLPNS